MDLPEDCLSPTERTVYAALLDTLECRDLVHRHVIERFAPLPAQIADYDLMTAFLVCFNRHRQADEWGLAEWRYFVEDALLRLRPGGALIIGLNDNPEQFGKLRFYNEALLQYFQSVGKVRGARIEITRATDRTRSEPALGGIALPLGPRQ
jgi:hypothetical protein